MVQPFIFIVQETMHFYHLPLNFKGRHPAKTGLLLARDLMVGGGVLSPG
jgi:hypothetical protein